jgi:hypothetical protein
VGAPKEIMGELFVCRLFETGHIDPLRIRAANDVADVRKSMMASSFVTCLALPDRM